MKISEKAYYIRQRILERNIECCKAITPEQMEIISILAMEHDCYNIVSEKNNIIAESVKNALIQNNLMLIALENESSAPKVFYKGEEIKFKTNVTFDWETDTDTSGGLSYAIERYVKENGYPILDRIERRVKGHAIN